jgi:hypothetical protein
MRPIIVATVAIPVVVASAIIAATIMTETRPPMIIKRKTETRPPMIIKRKTRTHTGQYQNSKRN